VSPCVNFMKIKLHKFKPSGKWYEEFEDTFGDNISFYDLQTEIMERHEQGKYGQYGEGKPWFVLYIGEQHPEGYPFISRG
jgi:hypothetical protein